LKTREKAKGKKQKHPIFLLLIFVLVLIRAIRVHSWLICLDSRSFAFIRG